MSIDKCTPQPLSEKHLFAVDDDQYEDPQLDKVQP